MRSRKPARARMRARAPVCAPNPPLTQARSRSLARTRAYQKQGAPHAIAAPVSVIKQGLGVADGRFPGEAFEPVEFRIGLMIIGDVNDLTGQRRGRAVADKALQAALIPGTCTSASLSC